MSTGDPRRRPSLQRHSSFPLPKPEIQRSAPPRRRPILGPPAPKPKPVGVFAQPGPVAPTTTLRHAQRQAAQRTRRVAARIPQPVPTVPVIAPRDQPHGYRRAVERLARPLAQKIHNRARADELKGRSYKQSVSEQLDALGPNARKLFRAYLETVAGPAASKRETARERALFLQSGGRFKRGSIELGGVRGYTLPTVQPVGGDAAWQAMVRSRQLKPGPGKRSPLSLSGFNPIAGLGLLPRFLAGPVATAVQQSGGTNLAGALRMTREPEEILRTYREHPETIARDFAYQRDFLLGTAAIPYRLIRDPKGTVRSLPAMLKSLPQGVLQDEIARHRAAFEGNYGAFRNTVRKAGATPYLFDYAAALSAVGKGAGLVARAGGFGKRLEEFAARPRAQMRTAGEVRLQRDETRKVAPNLLRLHLQNRRDVRRARSFERRDVKARQRAAEFNRRGEPGQGNRRFIRPQSYPGEGPGKARMTISQLAARRQAVEHVVERAGGKLHRDKRGRVESVRFTAERAAAADAGHFARVSKRLEQMGFERRRVGGNLVFYAPKEVTRRSRFLENRDIRSIPAHLKGVAVTEIRGTTAEEAHAFAQAAGPSARFLRIKGLSKHERAALFLAGTGRLPADNPARAVERLNAIEKRIRAEIGPGRPAGRYATDVLKRIAYLRRHADEAFTPNLRKAILKIGAQVRRGERENPFLVPTQRIAARYGPGALELGVERRPGGGRIHGARTTEGKVPASGGVAFDVEASAKSIARNREKVAGRERGGFHQGERTLRERDAVLRDRQTSLNNAMNRRSEMIRRLASQAREDEAAGDVAHANQWRDRIGVIAKDNQDDWIEANRIGRARDALDRQMFAIRQRGGASGRPEAQAARIDWYHGTPVHFSGPPTSEGKWSDLGVYLTSDPGYARHGYAGEGGRVMKVRVTPKKILETRFGRIDPGEMTTVVERLLDRARAAAKRPPELGRYGVSPLTIPGLEGALRRLRNPEFKAAISGGAVAAAKREDLLQEWRDFDVSLREASSEIRSAEGGVGKVGMGHGPLREILQSLGYDAVRKVDVYADALVVLDEKLLGRRPRSDEIRGWLLEGAKKERGETTSEWVKRVRKAMADNGIDHPPFFAPSEELRTPKYSIYTAGGARSPEPTKHRTGALQRRGGERSDAEVIFEGIQRNHRTRISAQLVADVFDRTAHHQYQNIATHELKKLAQNEGFDPSEYAVWYPKLYRDTLRNRLVAEQQGAAEGFGAAASQLEQEAAAHGSAFGHLRELLDPQSQHAVIVGADNLKDLYAQLDNPRFAAERGTLIPRAAADEMLASTKETAAGRMMERLKTLQSRAVLGGLNLNWLQADAVVNTLVGTVFGGTSPAAYFQQHGFFRDLPPDVKRWAHDELDVGSARSNTHIPRLGATVNNRFVNFFRFLRESPWGQRVRPVQRTINAFLSFERGVANNPQRRALAYHLLRKEAFRQLDQDVGAMNGILHRVSSVFSFGAYTPDAVRKQMLAIIRNKREFEEIGRRTADILGDWTTFTALERKTLGRYFFFYPYLRYSMKLAFYTLPLDHPIRLALVANLANLNMDEQRRLIGATEDDTYLVAGRYFYRDSKGVMHEYNVRTFNPVGNVVTEAQTSADLLQLMPPVVTIALGQIEKRDIYRGRDWRLKGTANAQAANDIGPLDGLLGTERWRVLAKQLIELPPLTREIAKYMLPGEQGDDSLPFSPRPTEFKDPVRQAQAERKRKRETTSLAERFLQDQFRVAVSKPSDIEEVLQRRHAHRPGGTRAGSSGRGSGWGSGAAPVGAGAGWGGSSSATSGWGG